MNSLFAFLFAFLVSGIAQAGSTPLSGYWIEKPSITELQTVSKDFEIVRRDSEGIEILVPQNRASEFMRLAPSARLLEIDSSAPVRKVYSQGRKNRGAKSTYHSFTEVVEILNATAKANPTLTQLENYGKTAEGKPLLALRVSKHFNSLPAVPRILLTAATHGDEIITTEVLLSLMNDVITGAPTSSRLSRLLDQMEIVFIPVVNPDGFSNQDRYEKGIDPNRSYPYPEKPNAVATPSIAAELKFIEKYPIAGCIDFHAYSGLVMYPWGYTMDAPEASDKEKFEALSSKMAQTNDYGFGQISDIMYIAKGSSVDFYFWKNKTIALGIELGNSKAPALSEIPKYIQEQQESTWVFLESFAK